MADKPRPPMASLDAAWDEDTALAPRGPAVNLPPPAPAPPSPVRPPRPPEVRRTRTGTAVIPRLPDDATASSPPRDADRVEMDNPRTPEPADTAVLPANELDVLVGRTSSPLGQSSDTITLAQQEMDQLLEHERETTGRARVPSAPPPPPQWRNADDFAYPPAPFGAPAPPPAADDEVSGAFGRIGAGPVSSPELASALEPEQTASPDASELRDSDAGGFSPASPEISDPDTATTAVSPPPTPLPPPALGASPFGTAFLQPPPPPSPSLGQNTPLPHAYGRRQAPGAPTPTARATSTQPSFSKLTLAVVCATAVALAGGTVLLKRLLYADKKSDRAHTTGLVLPAGAPQPPPPGGVEVEVREALERLRDGVQSCVKSNIGVLPGTSPAIPSKLGAAAGAGGYASTVADWRTPVWSCTRFSMSRPQRFQIQWQQQRVRSQGMGVAWVDDNGDGKPDRAFGFKGTLKKRGEVELGAIEPIEATHAVTPTR